MTEILHRLRVLGPWALGGALVAVPLYFLVKAWLTRG